MKLFATFAAGAFIGTAIAMLAAPSVPPRSDCSLYKVDMRTVTSYALKPPPAEIVYKACPQTTEKACVTKAPENDTQPELSNADDTQKPRRHRRHRVRRHW